MHVHDTHEAESSFADGERTAVRSQLGRDVGDLRELAGGSRNQDATSKRALSSARTLTLLRLARGGTWQALIHGQGPPGRRPARRSPCRAISPVRLRLGTRGRSLCRHLPAQSGAAVRCSAFESRGCRARQLGVHCTWLFSQRGRLATHSRNVGEARSVADVLQVEPLLDANATKPRVADALRRSRRIHIATHGAMDVDAPAFQMLVLHPAEDEQAGRLYAYEVLDLDLRALELVTLSACETALSRFDRADNLRGMAASLFSAGVATVIGTLWPSNLTRPRSSSRRSTRRSSRVTVGATLSARRSRSRASASRSIAIGGPFTSPETGAESEPWLGSRGHCQLDWLLAELADDKRSAHLQRVAVLGRDHQPGAAGGSSLREVRRRGHSLHQFQRGLEILNPGGILAVDDML